MVKLNQDEIREIYNDRNFITQTHHLSNALGENVPDEEAADMLFLYFTEYRLRNWTHEEFSKAWQDRSTKYEKGKRNRQFLKWIITFSRKDIVNRMQKEKERLESQTNYLTAFYDEEQDNQPAETNQELLDAVYQSLNVLFSNFKSDESYKVIKDVYNNEVNSDSLDRDLKRLSKVCKMKSRKNKLSKILNDNIYLQEKQELTFIDTFLALEEEAEINENVNLSIIDAKEIELIERNKELFEDYVGYIGGVNQVKLVNDYQHANNSDKVKVVEYMEQRQKYLKELLSE